MGDVSWEAVRDLVRADRRGALVTVVAGPGLGAKLLVTPEAAECSLGDAALDAEATRLARELLPAEATSAAVLPHAPRFDDPTLTALLRSRVAWIGAMGSRRVPAGRLERL